MTKLNLAREWYEGKDLDEGEIGCGVIKKRIKRTFYFECRARGQITESSWRKGWSKYKTAKDRDKAVKCLNKKNDWYEYRIPPE